MSPLSKIVTEEGNSIVPRPNESTGYFPIYLKARFQGLQGEASGRKIGFDLQNPFKFPDGFGDSIFSGVVFSQVIVGLHKIGNRGDVVTCVALGP